jgi:ABC-type bacteriocin/lantibiotic exporter with double-glycine peptidase domain
VNTRTAWLVYSALRIVFFAVPFLVLYFMGWHWLLAAVVATLVAVSLSVIFLSKQRQTAAESIQAWRDRDRTADDVVEDAAVDGAASTETDPTTDTTAKD